MDRKHILFQVRTFLAEYILFSTVCMIGLVIAWRLRNHIGMFVIAIPTSLGYLIFLLKKLVRIFQDVYMGSIVIEEVRILSGIERRFELLFMKSFYKIEVCNNSKNKNQKKTLIMLKHENIELNGLCKITYLQRSQLVVKFETM